MSADGILWVAMTVIKWSDVQTNMLSAASMPGGCCGFVPVFASKEAAEQFSEGRFPVKPIQGLPREEERA